MFLNYLGSSNVAPEPTDGTAKPSERAPAVRFSSVVDEIDPPFTTFGGPDSRRESSANPDLIRALTNSLSGAQLQEQRLQNYSFDPFSLPPSRVCSLLLAHMVLMLAFTLTFALCSLSYGYRSIGNIDEASIAIG